MAMKYTQVILQVIPPKNKLRPESIGKDESSESFVI
jgi:hypothetical protein